MLNKIVCYENNKKVFFNGSYEDLILWVLWLFLNLFFLIILLYFFLLFCVVKCVIKLKYGNKFV